MEMNKQQAERLAQLVAKYGRFRMISPQEEMAQRDRNFMDGDIDRPDDPYSDYNA